MLHILIEIAVSWQDRFPFRISKSTEVGCSTLKVEAANFFCTYPSNYSSQNTVGLILNSPLWELLVLILLPTDNALHTKAVQAMSPNVNRSDRLVLRYMKSANVAKKHTRLRGAAAL